MNIRKEFQNTIAQIIKDNDTLSYLELRKLIDEEFKSDQVYFRIWAEERAKAVNKWLLSKQQKIIQGALEYSSRKDQFITFLNDQIESKQKL